MGVYLFDQYSLLHFAGGVLAYFWGSPPLYFLFSHAIFELIENTDAGMHFINTYLWFWPGGKPKPDTLMNMLGDNIAAQAGYWFAKWLDDEGEKRGWYVSRKPLKA
jgi:hypothetical protein